MPINQNQFRMIPVAGQVDQQFTGTITSAQVSKNQSAGSPLVAGQAVRIEDSAGGVPKVLSLALDTDAIFGVVTYNSKDISDGPGAALELAMEGSVIYMTAGGAIARGARVQYNTATNKVTTQGGVLPAIGFAFDKAAADGDVIRIYITATNAGLANGAQKVATVVATLAEINAGKVLIPGATGKQILVSNFVERVTGAFTTGTSVDLVAETTTATKVVVNAEAGLTNGAVLIPGSANTTLGAGFGAPLPAGEGLKVVNVGAAQAGGTSISFTITYQYV